MTKIIFSVSYEIVSERRNDYLKLMKKVKKQIRKSTNQSYSVFEDGSHPNLMTEVYFLEKSSDVEEIKKLQKKKTDSLLSQIDQFVLNQALVSIRTFNEVI